MKTFNFNDADLREIDREIDRCECMARAAVGVAYLITFICIGLAIFS